MQRESRQVGPWSRSGTAGRLGASLVWQGFALARIEVDRLAAGVDQGLGPGHRPHVKALPARGHPIATLLLHRETFPIALADVGFDLGDAFGRDAQLLERVAAEGDRALERLADLVVDPAL